MAAAAALTEVDGVDDIDCVLREHQSTDAFNLSEAARSALSSEVNRDKTRLEVIEERAGLARLKATEHVGIVSLPDGPTVEIRAKAPGTSLLTLLRFAHAVEGSTVDQPTSIKGGRTFIEALGALYNAELGSTLKQGLHRDYRQMEEAETHLRGRLDVPRQLRRQGATPTEFECSYSELTPDTTVNRSVLYATELLSRLIQNRSLSQALQKHAHQLRRHVTRTHVRAVELEGVELSRLTDHYKDLLQLTKLVLRSVYIKELRRGQRASFALLVNMNEVFESAVERAVKEGLSDRSELVVRGQASSQSLISGGQRTITIRPDILVEDRHGNPVLVGDAKWKLDDPDNDNKEPSNADIYQLIAYQVAHDVPGVLFYPAQKGRVSSSYAVRNLHPLRTVEVPISSEDSGESYARTVTAGISEVLSDIEGTPV